jgi:hypothetical protein
MGLRQVFRAVLGQDADQERCLPGDLHQDAGTVQDCGLDRIDNQIVQEVPRLRSNSQRRQAADLLCQNLFR